MRNRVYATAWSQTSSSVRVAIVAIASVAVASAARAQLSREDIEALRERGKREGWTFTVGENSATRLPVRALCGSVTPPDWHKLAPFDATAAAPEASLPAAWDWRAWSCTTPIRSQGQCGSCWAFGAIGALESIILINDGVSVDLSEQWLVSCTGAGDCSGGFHGSAFGYLRCGGSTDPCGHSGAVWETEFPYVARNDPCGCPYTHPYCLSDWSYIGTWPFPTNTQIKQAIYDHGPVTVGMSVNDAFLAYTGGVFNACGGTILGQHAVVLVGWDDSQGSAGVWILRNSWDSDWGEGGYARIEYDCLSVGQQAAYVTYADTAAGVWVDFGYSGSETGSFWSPYNTLTEGINAVATGGVVTIKTGVTGGTWTLSKAMTLRAAGGTVTIGQ